MRILSGVQPSGKLHLGNYYGAIRQFVHLQEQGEALYFIANLHSLTTVRDGELHRQLIRETAVAFLALGVDPKRATLFRHSDVPEVTELTWVLSTVIPLSHLERAHSYKDKIAKGISPDAGLMFYPVLMAADILVYDSDVVPVGKDQTQHLEFARDWATKFNMTYVKGYDPADPTGEKNGARGVLKLPGAMIREDVATIPGTDGEKMSKSYNNTIDLFGDEKEVKKRIMGIKTDSTPVEAPKPTDNALYQLLKIMAPPGEFEAIDQSWKAGGRGYGDYKKKLLEYYHATFDGPRARYAELMRDPAELDRILADGARRAREYAAPVMDRVLRAVGIRENGRMRPSGVNGPRVSSSARTDASPAPRVPPSAKHAVVVFGCPVNAKTGAPTPALTRRLEQALTEAKKDPSAVLVVSGGAAHNRFPESVAMRDWLVQRGVDPARILVEDRSSDTIENAENVAAMLQGGGVKRVTVVTERYHERRAHLLLANALAFRGVKAQLDDSPAPDGLSGLAAFKKSFAEDKLLVLCLAKQEWRHLRAGQSFFG